MNAVRLTALAFAAALALGVAACGGGSIGGGTFAEGGIGGTGISQGSITGFGSVIVNGVEYGTSTADVTVDGVTATQDELAIGMVVTVTGTINPDGTTGTADSVEYSDVLEGPISNVIGNSVTVMGRTVLIDNLTRFENVTPSNDINGLGRGDVIEVSGFEAPGGEIRATFIEEKPAGGEIEVKGEIASIAGTDFTIGSLVIDGSQLDLTGFNVGNYVEVSGFNIDGFDRLVATEIEHATADLGDTDREEAEKEGLVTSVVPAGEFFLSGQRVTYDPNLGGTTQYDGGLPTDIKVGVRLEVEGTLVNGVLNATRIEFQDAIELEADVSARTGNTLTLEYPGQGNVTVEVSDNLTQYSGPGDLASVSAGDHVKIRGRKTNGTVFATELEESSDTELALQGPVDSFVSGDSITILGITVFTAGLSFELDGNASNSADFYQALDQGDLVEVEGELVGGTTVSWEDIELDQ